MIEAWHLIAFETLARPVCVHLGPTTRTARGCIHGPFSIWLRLAVTVTYRIFRSNFAAQELDGSVRNDFVDVHVGLCTYGNA